MKNEVDIADLDDISDYIIPIDSELKSMQTLLKMFSLVYADKRNMLDSYESTDTGKFVIGCKDITNIIKRLLMHQNELYQNLEELAEFFEMKTGDIASIDVPRWKRLNDEKSN